MAIAGASCSGPLMVSNLGSTTCTGGSMKTKFYLLKSNKYRSLTDRKPSKKLFQLLEISSIPTGNPSPKIVQLRCAAAARNGHQSLPHEREPFWMSLMKDITWSLRSLVGFLIEQPSQLKHLEWPTFQSTIKTAGLTLVIVAVLIVALSSIDSALCYMLAMLLRRTA